MAEEATSTTASFERREDAATSIDQDKAAVRYWLAELALAESEEKDWREDAEKVVKRYRGEKGEYDTQRYRLLYSNTETEAPALFNSMPIPDIRRRYNDRDPDAQAVAQALERVISCQAEKCDFEDQMDEAVLHMLLPSRAVVRVRYVPHLVAKTDDQGNTIRDDKNNPVEELANETVEWEVVPWTDFRRGPAKRWKDTPWVGFRIYPTRDELTALSPEHGPKVPLNARPTDGKIGAKDNGGPAPTVFKQAEVWQIWDKEKRQIVYICPDYLDAPIATKDDELRLEGFFPTPKPLLAIKSPDDQRPVTKWSQYASLAEELEDITQRLRKLVKAAKWRGVTAKELGGAFKAMESLDDGKLAPAEDAIVFSAEGGIDKAIWIMPIDKLIAAIQQLYEAREQTKQTIYEVTGLSDILRGSTEASETATAQGIKAQWGSLRMQKGQRAVQRYVRDLFRIGVEIVATKFDPKSIMLASGITLEPKQIELMRRDVIREYRIDVETDSTIRADLSRQQENMGQFVQGFSALTTALGPPVQAGVMMPDEAADLLTGFARSFKLGKQAEDALERMGDRLRQQTAQGGGQGGGQPSPEQQKADAQAQMHQQEIAFMQQKAQIDMAMQDKQLEIKERELALKEREAQLRAQELDMNHRYKMAEMVAGEQAAQNGHTRDMERLMASREVGVPGPGARQ